MFDRDLTVPRGVPESNAARASALAPEHARSGALVIDGSGTIVRCSDAVRRMFGGGDFEGSKISSLVKSLVPSSTSPSYNARYLAYLSLAGDWREFQALDTFGRPFGVEIAMSRLGPEDHDYLLLNLRLRGAQ